MLGSDSSPKNVYVRISVQLIVFTSEGVDVMVREKVFTVTLDEARRVKVWDLVYPSFPEILEKVEGVASK